jgi:general stress protein 26
MPPETIPQLAIDFIRSHRLATLTTFSSDSKYPESSLVYYLVDDRQNLIVLTPKASRKVQNIQKNPHVAFLIGQEVEPIVIQIQGTAKVITDPHLKSKMLEPYHQTANTNPESLSFAPLTKLAAGNNVEALTITIDKLKYSDFQGKTPTVYTYSKST